MNLLFLDSLQGYPYRKKVSFFNVRRATNLTARRNSPLLIITKFFLSKVYRNISSFSSMETQPCFSPRLSPSSNDVGWEVFSPLPTMKETE